MGGEVDHISNPDRIGENAGDHQPGDMRNICHQVSANFIRDPAQFMPVRRKGIAGIAPDDQARTMLQRKLANFRVIEPLSDRIDAI